MVTVSADNNGKVIEHKRPHEVDPAEAGCWVDNIHGYYMGEQIQLYAAAQGWRYSPQIEVVYVRDDNPDMETYDDAVVEAEEYMADLAPEGYSFGYSEGFGDWGLWHTHGDNEPEHCETCGY